MENRDIFISHLRSTPPLGGPRRNITVAFGTKKTRMVDLPDGEKSLRIRLLVLTQYANVMKIIIDHVDLYDIEDCLHWMVCILQLQFFICSLCSTKCTQKSIFWKKFQVLCPCVASRSFQFKPNPAKMDWVQITTAILQVCSWSYNACAFVLSDLTLLLQLNYRRDTAAWPLSYLYTILRNFMHCSIATYRTRALCLRC